MERCKTPIPLRQSLVFQTLMTDVPLLRKTWMICCIHDKRNSKLSLINLFMNVSSSFKKNSYLFFVNKKFDLVQKNQIYFCKCKKKLVFGIEKSDLCLLNKTKSFGLKKKNQIFFFRIRKIGFLFVLKNIRSDL